MATRLAHNPEYLKYKIIPEKVRNRLLHIRTQIDVRRHSYILNLHSEGGAWRFRWLDAYTGKHKSVSIGKDEQVVECAREIIALWKAGEFPLIDIEYPHAAFVPHQYHDKWLELEELAHKEHLRRIRRQDVRAAQMPFENSDAAREGYYAPECTERTVDTTAWLDKYRTLPLDLVERLLELKKEVNVLTNRLNVCYRKDRDSWCLRWRESDEYENVIHKSIGIGDDENVAETIRQLVEDWRNWKTPLFDILFAGSTVPPEYWGLDWRLRMMVSAKITPISPEVLKRMHIKVRGDSLYATVDASSKDLGVEVEPSFESKENIAADNLEYAC